MNDIDTKRLAEGSAFTMMVNGAPVLVAFSKTESAGLKDEVRDILTKSLEERYLESIKQKSE